MQGRTIAILGGVAVAGVVLVGVGLFAADWWLESKVEADVRAFLDDQDLEHTVDFDHVSVSIPWREVRFHGFEVDVPGASHPLTADAVGCSGYWQVDGFPTHADCRVEGMEAPPDLLTGFDPSGMSRMALGSDTADLDLRFAWALDDGDASLHMTHGVAVRELVAVESILEVGGLDVALARALMESEDGWALLDRLAGEEGARVAALSVQRFQLTVEDLGLRAGVLSSLGALAPGGDPAAFAASSAERLRAMGAGSDATGRARLDALADWVEHGGRVELVVGDRGPVSFYEEGPDGALHRGPLLTLGPSQLLEYLTPTLRHVAP